MNTAPTSNRQTGAFWFTSNFLPAPLAIGFVGPLQGLSLWQSLLAIVPAVLLASLVPARHRSLSALFPTHDLKQFPSVKIPASP